MQRNELDERKTMQPSRRDLLKMVVVGSGGILYAGLAQHLDLEALARQVDPVRVYIAADDHTDLFWTANEADYLDAFVEVIDYYLDLTDATINEPADFQSRWNCDGSLWMWAYEKQKSPEEFLRFIEQVRSGHISVPLNSLVLCLGGAPTEAILRGMYYPGKIERQHNLRFMLATCIENQTQPYGLGALWAGAGAKYSWKGVCGCDTRVTELTDRDLPMYWWDGPDGSRILMKWYSVTDNQFLGGYAEARRTEEVVDALSADWFLNRVGYRVVAAFGKGWDDFKTMTDDFVTVAKEKTNANRRIIVSNETDFFADFEATYGEQLPTQAVSFGNEWELYCAALAEVSASIKRSTERLRSAEALAALANVSGTSLPAHIGERDQAWLNLGLFWEHNFGVANPNYTTERIAWQRRLDNEVKSYVDTLHDEALTTLGTRISKDSSDFCFFVFNPLSWSRSDLVDLPESAIPGGLPATFHVIDMDDGRGIPYQIISRDGVNFLRVFAIDVPSVGYKVYELLPGPGRTTFNRFVTQDGNTLENPLYRVTLNGDGAITSLIDKTDNNRELVPTGTSLNKLENVSSEIPGSGTGSVTVENDGVMSVTLVATSDNPLPHTTRLTLYCECPRIDIENRITANFDDTHTWDYPLAIDKPTVWHEEVGAVIQAKLVSEGGHYATRNARYDWLTLNHFANMQGSDGTNVTLSNADCYYMQLGNSTPAVLDTATARIAVLAGGRVGGDGSSGIPDQGGDTSFLQRFALRTHTKYLPVESMRFALEHQNPLVAGAVNGGDASLPGNSYSLVSVSDPDVLLWAFKPADDTPDFILRLWNLTSNNKEFQVTFGDKSVTAAEEVTHIETPIGPANISNGALNAVLNGHQLKTYQVTLA